VNALVMFAALCLALAGVVTIAAALRQPALNPAAVLAELDADLEVDEYNEQLSQSLATRLLKPMGRSIASKFGALLPSRALQRARHQLLVAGLLDELRPEEFIVIRIVTTFGGFGAALGLARLLNEPGAATFKAAVVLTIIGNMLPSAWLRRHRDARVASIKQDLPDVLDLLAISVEAGAGFEYAVDVATRHFDSPLARELARTLREMELGLTRKEAMQNLKHRTEVPELSNFVLTLIQADALGMPIGRVLHTQAAEMRAKRRQWAREKAGKLPVKIMFPLVMFIFPALLVVVLGPAASSIMKGL
jgi:tight adherence protein C